MEQANRVSGFLGGETGLDRHDIWPQAALTTAKGHRAVNRGATQKQRGGLRRPVESQKPRARAPSTTLRTGPRHTDCRASLGWDGQNARPHAGKFPHKQIYVPSFQLAKYSSCSEVRRSILMPMDSSFSLATRLSKSTGTV